MEQPGSGIQALREQRAFVDLSDWRKIGVVGSQARSWLQDLITADVGALAPGQATRSLLLTPTGRIRADFHVAVREDDILLLQAPDQPEHVGLILAPYVLSSDVELHDATSELALVAVLGAAAALVAVPGTSPSALGPGVDLALGSGRPAWKLEESLVKAGLVEVDRDTAEAWRVLQGNPRMGPDFDQASLPAEAGLDEVVAHHKGCFLGQESVARVRNLGHPPRVLRHLEADGVVTPDRSVFAGDEAVGTITSSAVDPAGRSVVIARVRWEAATAGLSLADGRTLAEIASEG